MQTIIEEVRTRIILIFKGRRQQRAATAALSPLSSLQHRSRGQSTPRKSGPKNTVTGRKRPIEHAAPCDGSTNKRSRLTTAVHLTNDPIGEASHLIDTQKYKEAIIALGTPHATKNYHTLIHAQSLIGEARRGLSEESAVPSQTRTRHLHAALISFSTAAAVGEVLLDNSPHPRHHHPKLLTQVAHSCLRWANVCQLLGFAGDAVFACKKYIQIHPKHNVSKVLNRAKFNMDEIVKSDGKLDASTKDRKQCISMRPVSEKKEHVQEDGVNQEALNTLAQMYMEQNRFNDAIPILKRLAGINPPQADAWKALGDAYSKTNQVEHALLMYNVYIVIHARANPTMSVDTINCLCEMLKKVGCIHIRRKQYAKAEQSFHECIRVFMMRPEMNNISPLLSMCLQLNNTFDKVGKRKVGVELLRIACDIVETRQGGPTEHDAIYSAQVYDAMGDVYLDENNVLTSIEHYKKALYIYQRHCRQETGKIQAMRGKIENANAKRDAKQT